MTKAKRVEEKLNELDRLFETLTAAKKLMKAFEKDDETAKILEEWSEMKNSIEGITERIKIEARKRSKLGDTVVLIDNADIHVSVQGRGHREFDLDKMKKFWPAEAYKKATKLVVDKGIVDSLVKVGTLDEDVLEKTSTYEADTPAVSIRLL